MGGEEEEDYEGEEEELDEDDEEEYICFDTSPTADDRSHIARLHSSEGYSSRLCDDGYGEATDHEEEEEEYEGEEEEEEEEHVCSDDSIDIARRDAPERRPSSSS